VADERDRVLLRVGDFSKDVSAWMKTCIRRGGVPIFKTRFRNIDFGDNVLGICYGAAGAVPSSLFTNVPEEDRKAFLTESPDWPYVALKYGDEELKRMAREFGKRQP
jgi:hypothetical protein